MRHLFEKRGALKNLINILKRWAFLLTALVSSLCVHCDHTPVSFTSHEVGAMHCVLLSQNAHGAIGAWLARASTDSLTLDYLQALFI